MLIIYVASSLVFKLFHSLQNYLLLHHLAVTCYTQMTTIHLYSYY